MQSDARAPGPARAGGVMQRHAKRSVSERERGREGERDVSMPRRAAPMAPMLHGSRAWGPRRAAHAAAPAPPGEAARGAERVSRLGHHTEALPTLRLVEPREDEMADESGLTCGHLQHSSSRDGGGVRWAVRVIVVICHGGSDALEQPHALQPCVPVEPLEHALPAPWKSRPCHSPTSLGLPRGHQSTGQYAHWLTCTDSPCIPGGLFDPREGLVKMMLPQQAGSGCDGCFSARRGKGPCDRARRNRLKAANHHVRREHVQEVLTPPDPTGGGIARERTAGHTLRRFFPATKTANIPVPSGAGVGKLVVGLACATLYSSCLPPAQCKEPGARPTLLHPCMHRQNRFCLFMPHPPSTACPLSQPLYTLSDGVRSATDYRDARPPSSRAVQRARRVLHRPYLVLLRAQEGSECTVGTRVGATVGRWGGSRAPAGAIQA